jgi:hypothetical protein
MGLYPKKKGFCRNPLQLASIHLKELEFSHQRCAKENALITWEHAHPFGVARGSRRPLCPGRKVDPKLSYLRGSRGRLPLGCSPSLGREEVTLLNSIKNSRITIDRGFLQTNQNHLFRVFPPPGAPPYCIGDKLPASRFRSSLMYHHPPRGDMIGARKGNCLVGKK